MSTQAESSAHRGASAAPAGRVGVGSARPIPERVLEDGTVLAPATFEVPGYWSAQAVVRVDGPPGVGRCDTHGMASVRDSGGPQRAIEAALLDAADRIIANPNLRGRDSRVVDVQAHWCESYSNVLLTVLP